MLSSNRRYIKDTYTCVLVGVCLIYYYTVPNLLQQQAEQRVLVCAMLHSLALPPTKTAAWAVAGTQFTGFTGVKTKIL